VFILNAAWSKHVPQGLKPASLVTVIGTTEVVPFPVDMTPTFFNSYRFSIRIQRFDYCVVEFRPDLFYGLVGAVGPGAVG
jgi:hypothetical protein